MPKSRPKTGEKRQVNQPLKIDRLPPEVRDTIQYLYNVAGKTWQEIEELSSLEYSEKWQEGKGGFVNWHNLPLSVLELFPEMRLPRTSLHRWFDLRVKQVRSQVLAEGDTALKFAEKLAAQSMPEVNSAVVSALRNEVFSLMRSAGSDDRQAFMKGLQDFTLALTRIQRVELQEKRVKAELAKLDADRARLAAEAGDPREIYLQAVQDVLKKLRTRTAVRTALDPIQEELIQEFSIGAESFAKQIEARAS